MAHFDHSQFRSVRLKDPNGCLWLERPSTVSYRFAKLKSGLYKRKHEIVPLSTALDSPTPVVVRQN